MGIFGFGILGLILLVIVIALKGLALWHSAKRGEKWWFIAMLVINTAGILELVYLIFFVKMRFDQIFPKKSNTPNIPSTPNTPAAPTN